MRGSRTKITVTSAPPQGGEIIKFQIINIYQKLIQNSNKQTEKKQVPVTFQPNKKVPSTSSSENRGHTKTCQLVALQGQVLWDDQKICGATQQKHENKSNS
eukprot:TRINITY_DN292_c0_g3_i1.p11 TRINITY_DN292_c0_g3~~TRINITY_DN292_c0_g3_i1.p11  ORF type:complete len:101 (-),score=15.83 TRINITY_DN292_c0_g3_i1:2352-2654(-)